MTTVRQKILLEDYLPDDVNDESMHEIVTALYCAYMKYSSVPMENINFWLFVHPHVLPYVYTVRKKLMLKMSNETIWERSYNIEVVMVKGMTKNKIVLMVGM